jgi:hypothetical protein
MHGTHSPLPLASKVNTRHWEKNESKAGHITSEHWDMIEENKAPTTPEYVQLVST